MTRAELLDTLASRVEAASRPGAPRVAVDGPDAAGKTILADELASTLRARGREVARASIDAFLRPREERYRQGPESPSGYYEDSFDHAAVRAAVLGARAILLFDGVFLLRPELADLWDLRIFVRVEPEETIRRALAREAHLFGSVEETERRYRTRYLPGHQLYLAEARPLEAADIVVVNDDPAAPRLL